MVFFWDYVVISDHKGNALALVKIMANFIGINHRN